ncbi:SpaH/EbpB family LPXTG-anchored major pilin [Leucobacter soli]|uniref:SpaH/EbpB family LPXTG-anchored major pilin n=1 Tax=Leucobacter soli TaxID=2812850 RepID=UPI003618889C
MQAGQPGGPTVDTTGGIDGVQFTIERVDAINLSTNAGWQAAGDAVLDLANPSAPVVRTSAIDTTPLAVSAATGSPFTTTGGGLINATLPIGLYLVRETVPAPGSAPAVPFLVTLPMTNPSNTSDWMRDVYVYPKNSQTAITKSVSDIPKYQAGSPNALVTWTIDAEVPRTPGSTSGSWVRPSSYVISDDIDDYLAPQTVTVTAVDNAGNAIVGANQLVSGDYTIAPAVLPAAAGTDVTVTFASGGLDKLQALAATAGNKIRVTIGTLVVAEAEGRIENDASVAVNGGTAVTTTTPAVTEWRNVSFSKVDQAGTGLASAEFQVFGTKADAEGTTSPLLTSTAASAAAPDLGEVDLGSLIRSDHLNGAVITNLAQYRVYWLVETKAPTGYELLAQPVPFVVLDGGAFHATVNASGEVTAVGVALGEIENVQKNAGFVLPLTGGMGTAILTIGGIAILAIVLLVARRRRDVEATAAE